MDSSLRPTPAGKIALTLLVIACAVGAWRFAKPYLSQLPSSSSTAPNVSGETPPPQGGKVEIGVAYGTEKRRWLESAVASFAETPKGRRIQVNLIPLGSIEGANAVLNGDTRIHLWTPASSLYQDVFLSEWSTRHSGAPILRQESLALTPMVFVMWAERHEAFLARYKELSFQTVAEALQEPSGWQGIAAKPEWGLFKFGHTHPNESNSGLATLCLMAHSYHAKTKTLAMKDILDPKFQSWLTSVQRGVSGLSNSTGNMMKEMVLKGPSTYDALFLYESAVIDYLKNAEGRWGELRVAYPHYNIWNDNPAYILDVPWSSPAQRSAASAFVDYLLSEPVQKTSLIHGFRPSNPAVAINGPDSPFTLGQRYGIRMEPGQICENPKAEIIHNLLATWQRQHGSR